MPETPESPARQARSSRFGALVSRAAVAVLVFAASGAVHVPQAWALDYAAGVTTTYDDNFLGYSDRDLFTFRYRLNPTRYGVSTTDDLVIASYLEAAWVPDPRGATSIQARLDAERYATNGIRNNMRTTLLWRGRPWDHWRVAVAGEVVPSYYVRRYIDYDASLPYPGILRFRDARYREGEVSATADWWPTSRWRTQIGYAFARRVYLGAFPERNENRHLVNLMLRLPRAGRVETRLHGSYGRALARGPQGDVGSGRPDISNESFGTGLSLAWSPPLRGPSLTLGQIVDYEDIRYTTSDRTDACRYGRSIHELDLHWDVAWAFLRHWVLGAGYHRVLQRKTGTLSDIETFTDAGSYDRNRVSVGLGWSSRPSRAE